MKPGFVYIITNHTNTTLYVGVTSNLHDRIKQHQEKRFPNSFSAKYNLNKLVYFETFQMIEDAIGREKQIKGGSRIKKIKLIETLNSEWDDLYYRIEEFLLIATLRFTLLAMTCGMSLRGGTTKQSFEVNLWLSITV